ALGSIGAGALPDRYEVTRLWPLWAFGRIASPWARMSSANLPTLSAEWVTAPYHTAAPPPVASRATTIASDTARSARNRDTTSCSTTASAKTPAARYVVE